jgi:hypothetical protein
MVQAPLYFAPRQGQDWRDEECLRAVRWLTGFADPDQWARRMEVVRQRFADGCNRSMAGERDVELFAPADLIAWYVFQAEAYASRREDAYEPEYYRIAPLFKRIGQLVDRLETVEGVAERVSRLMDENRATPDDGLYELLVAGAYRSRDWPSVAFVPEQKGIRQTNDLMVSSGSRRWAVECKRAGRSSYEEEEQRHAKGITANFHEFCRSRRRSLAIGAIFTRELSDVPADYLAERAEAFLSNREDSGWRDDIGYGGVRGIDWGPMRTVLSRDDIFVGGSRMVELLVGNHTDFADHDVYADWVPRDDRPFFATDVSHASVASWISGSAEAAGRKARHFRGIVGRAADQLPGDCPGVVHVGYESKRGNEVDRERHRSNIAQMRTFDPGASRLRWVYGNYVKAEHVTAQFESAAVSETTAAYRVGSHKTPEPLESHLLYGDGDGDSGNHWGPLLRRPT